MIEKIEKITFIIMMIIVLWFVASWADILCHNNPSEEDGEPSSWNTFVVLQDFLG